MVVWVKVMAVEMKRIGQIWDKVEVELVKLANNDSVGKMLS